MHSDFYVDYAFSHNSIQSMLGTALKCSKITRKAKLFQRVLCLLSLIKEHIVLQKQDLNS